MFAFYRYALPFSLFAILIFSSIASAIDLPTRRSGLWESTVTMSMMNMTHKSKECVDAATDKKMFERTLNNNAKAENCQIKYGKEGNAIVVDTDCEKQGMKMKAKTKMSGDFQSSYSGTTVMNITGAPGGMKMPAQTIKHNAKWIGECPKDMNPGDMVMADGKKMNIGNM